MPEIALSWRARLFPLLALLAACDGLPDAGAVADPREPAAPVDDEGGPAAELPEAEIPADAPAAPADDDEDDVPPPFISRFAPHQGLVGTEVQILGTYCDPALECVVTIGGVPALPVDNAYVLTVTVAPGAVTGPLCVTRASQTTCGETFMVLTGPLIYARWPDTFPVGCDATAIDVTGDGFAPSSVVRLDGAPLVTTFRTPRELTAIVPASACAAAGTRRLDVLTPALDEPTSDEVPITIVNPSPAITGLAPTFVAAADPALITVSGASFVPASMVLIDGRDVRTTWLSATGLAAHLPADLAAGEHLVQVWTPAPGGGSSAPASLTVE